MGSSVYVKTKGNPGEYFRGRKVFTRLWHGPTWGIRSASRSLATLAQTGDVGRKDINAAIRKHPRLAIRLELAETHFTSIAEGTSQADIAKAFRVALYSSKELQARLDDIGFEWLEQGPKLPLVTLRSLFNSIEYDVSSDSYYARERTRTLQSLLKIPVSLGERISYHYYGSYILASIVCSALSVALVVGTGIIPERAHSGSIEIPREVGDTLVGLMLGTGLGLAIGHVKTRAWFARMKDKMTYTLMGAHYHLRRVTGEREFDEREAAIAHRIATSIGGEERFNYLASFGQANARKVAKIADRRGEIEAQALVRCRDISRDDLMELLFSALPVVRDRAFARLSRSLTAQEIEDAAGRLIAINALLDHPRASHASKSASVRATLVQYGRRGAEYVRAFAPQMTADDILEIFQALEEARGDVHDAYDWRHMANNFGAFCEIFISHDQMPLSILEYIARGRDFGKQAMDAIIARGLVQNVDLAALRESNSADVRLRSTFHYLDSTPNEMAHALSHYLPATVKIVDNEYEMTGPYGESWGMYQETHQEFGAEDMALARSLMELRDRGEWEDIIALVPEKMNRQFASKGVRSPNTDARDNLRFKLGKEMGIGDEG